MITDARAAKKLARWLEHLEETNVEARLAEAACFGFRGLAEQNPVALYLSRKVGRRVHVGPQPDWWAHAWSDPPERDVVASAQLPHGVRQFMELFDAGRRTTFEAGPAPKVETPWGRIDAVHRIAGDKLYYVRAEGDEGVVSRRSARLMIGDAAFAYATMCGDWACWGADAWPVAAHDLPGALATILKHAPIVPESVDQPERALVYALNTSGPGRSFLRATRSRLLWPDDAITTFLPAAGGLVRVTLAGGGSADVTTTSVVLAAQARNYPMRLVELEAVRDD